MSDAETRGAQGWSGTVFLWGANSFYLGVAAQTSAHAAHDVKVCVALRGTFRLRAAGDARWRAYRTAIIPSQQPHQLDGTGAQVCLIYFPPELSASERLRRTHVREVSDSTLRRVVPRLNNFLDRGCELEDVSELCREFVGDLSRESGARVPLDSRVANVLERLSCASDGRLASDEAARVAALSPSRLAHLFREQLGVPLRRYALELRLRRALLQVARDPSLTRAAHDSGFADSAHLSRTFRRMIGLSPSALTRRSRLVVG